MYQRIWTIMDKEWAETLRNRTIMGTILGLTALFLILPFAISSILPIFIGPAMMQSQNTPQMAERLGQIFPQLRGISDLGLFQVIMHLQFRLFFLLLIPIIGAISIATYSIIGEKQTRTLEPLLATPITTGELLLGKSLAAAIPPVLISWVGFLLYVLGLRTLTEPGVAGFIADTAAWLVAILISPLVALLGLGLGVIVSSRVNDPRSAQQIGTIIVLPIMGIIFGQIAGVFFLSVPIVVMSAVILLLIDGGVLAIGVKLFEREAILTRWK